MIKAKYTLGDKVTEIEFEAIEQLLEYERVQNGAAKSNSWQPPNPSTDHPISIPESGISWRKCMVIPVDQSAKLNLGCNDDMEFKC